MKIDPKNYIDTIKSLNETSQKYKILHTIPIKECKPTKSSYAIVTEHGFDTREFLEEFPEIENKKESDLLITYAQNKKEA